VRTHRVVDQIDGTAQSAEGMIGFLARSGGDQFHQRSVYAIEHSRNRVVFLLEAVDDRAKAGVA
jgi:hypothetical protein